MAVALDAAAAVKGTTAPNPWVGAAIATAGGGPMVAGATAPVGGPHAEVRALAAAARAGLDVRGATMAVTLEPCDHHGRTPPCTEAMLGAGISRVEVGVVDPDPRVGGRGVARLRSAGVDVTVGVGSAQVSEQLEAYLHHRRTGRPFVTLKLAATLDGRTAAPDGSSQWITGPDARRDAHRLRAERDAILVGAATVRRDDPSLTVRLVDGTDPRRFVLGAAPPGSKVHPCTEVAGPSARCSTTLGADGVIDLLVEGGATVAREFHLEGLIDHYVIYLAPALMGGDDAPGLFTGEGAATIADLWRGTIVAVTRLGDDLRVDLRARRQ